MITAVEQITELLKAKGIKCNEIRKVGSLCYECSGIDLHEQKNLLMQITDMGSGEWYVTVFTQSQILEFPEPQ